MPTLIQVILFLIELWKQLKKSNDDPEKLIQQVRVSLESLRKAKTIEEKHEARIRIASIVNKL